MAAARARHVVMSKRLTMPDYILVTEATLSKL
jgi:hypothetical protein